MNEQQAQTLAQRIRAHLPHVEVKVEKSYELENWIEASYPQDPEYPRPAHDDDGTWGCLIIVPGEDTTRATTRIARIFFEGAEWESYLKYEPLLERMVQQAGVSLLVTHHRDVSRDQEQNVASVRELLTAILQRDTIPALTFTEPWCSLMAMGKKRVETRSWHPHSYRGPIALHAASTLPRDLDALCHQDYFYETLALQHFRGGRWTFPTKHVLAVGMLEEVLPSEAIQVSEQEQAFGNYGPGRYAWQFSAIYRLKTPIIARGSLSLWQWSPPTSFWDEIQAQHDQVLSRESQEARPR